MPMPSVYEKAMELVDEGCAVCVLDGESMVSVRHIPPKGLKAHPQMFNDLRSNHKPTRARAIVELALLHPPPE